MKTMRFVQPGSRAAIETGPANAEAALKPASSTRGRVNAAGPGSNPTACKESA